MTTDEFWDIIDALQPGSGDMTRKCAALSARLTALPPDKARSFADHYWHCRRRAFHWPLWDAASLMYNGCGDDKFMDFRSALMLCGREVFERALTDPDTLAELPKPLPDGGGVFGAIHAVVGDEYRPPEKEPAEPTGSSLEDGEDYETAVRVRFPRLAARYLDEPPKGGEPARPWWKWW